MAAAHPSVPAIIRWSSGESFCRWRALHALLTRGKKVSTVTRHVRAAHVALLGFSRVVSSICRENRPTAERALQNFRLPPVRILLRVPSLVALFLRVLLFNASDAPLRVQLLV